MKCFFEKYIRFIILLLASWLAMVWLLHEWTYLEFRLILWRSDEGYAGSFVFGSFVYFIPVIYCVVFGFAMAALSARRKSWPERKAPERKAPEKKFVAWMGIVWAVPAIIVALWAPAYLNFTFIASRPPYYFGYLYPDFAVCCGVAAGLVIGSLRYIPIDKDGKTPLLPHAFKTIISAAVYFLLFCLSSVCVQQNIFKLYGTATAGLGGYWMTAGNVIFFGALFGVMFRLPLFPLRGVFVYRRDNKLILAIILAVLVALMGFVWEAYPGLYIPGFPMSRYCVPSIAVIWMFALGYILGSNIERKQATTNEDGSHD